jgi:hypothetical protein
MLRPVARLTARAWRAVSSTACSAERFKSREARLACFAKRLVFLSSVSAPLLVWMLVMRVPFMRQDVLGEWERAEQRTHSRRRGLL